MYRYIHICLFIVYILHTQSCRQQDAEIVDIYLLPLENKDTILHSFSIGTFKNNRALSNLNAIDRTQNGKQLLNILNDIEKGFFANPSKNPDAYTVYLKYKKNIRDLIENDSVPWNQKKAKAIYFFAFFLHEYYLYNARKGTLVLKETEGKTLYSNLAAGKIPDYLLYRKPKQSPALFVWGGMFFLLASLVFLTAYLIRGTEVYIKRKARTTEVENNTNASTEQKHISDAPYNNPYPIYSQKTRKKIKVPQNKQDLTTRSSPESLYEEKGSEESTLKKSEVEVSERGQTDLPELSSASDDLTWNQMGKGTIDESDKVEETATTSADERHSKVIPPLLNKVTKYVTLPSGKLFYKFYDQVTPGEPYFRLVIDAYNPKEATILLPDDPESLEFLLNSPAELGNVCVWESSVIKKPYTDVRYEAGKAEFKIKYWHIVVPIKIF